MVLTASFDHIEAHVKDVPAYCLFLVKLFGGGRHKVVDAAGTAMFISPEGLCVEVKKRAVPSPPAASGICQPCLRRSGAKRFIEEELGFPIDRTAENASGKVYFFTDREGVVWHLKDYAQKDEFVSW
ncbi:MAG TPA: hypothetical protein DCM05_02290 [Elusimicrobia bacterium]|nr:hypothetical protein [Elusimicrobiota bacterium]